MVRFVLIAGLLAAAPPPDPAAVTPPTPSAPSAPADGTITRINATPARDGWFVCDAVAGHRAVFAGKVDAAGNSLITLLDRQTGRFDTQTYQVGPADPGAGQIHWSLMQKGQEVGSVHGVNPGMVNSAGIAPIVGVTIGKETMQCRWLNNLRFLGLNSRRSFAITEGPEGLIYRSYDLKGRGPIRSDGVQVSNQSTLRIEGGREDEAGFHFDNQGYAFLIERHGTAPATVTVTQNGKTMLVETLVGYSWAPLPRSQPNVALGPGAVWDGKGLDACRRQDTGAGGSYAAAVGACMIDAMQRGGASASAIAFARTQIATKNPGYVSAWRQAGPVGIADVAYPFMANTNAGAMLVPTSGVPIMVDGYQPSTTDQARPDWIAAKKRSPEAFPVAPGEVSAAKVPAGESVIVRVRTRTATCRACKPVGAITVAYRFDRTGKLLSQGIEKVE